MKILILEQLRGMLTATDAKLRFAQANYKKCFDKTVRIKTLYQPGDMVFIDRSPAELHTFADPHQATPTTTTSAHGLINKLLPKSVGPYCVIRSSPINIVIEDGPGELKISIDRCTKAPPPDPQPAPPSIPLHDPNGTTTPLNDTTDINRNETPITTDDAAVTSDTAIRISSHYYNGKDITYTVLHSDGNLRSGLLFSDLKPDLILNYWKASTRTRTTKIRGRKPAPRSQQ